MSFKSSQNTESSRSYPTDRCHPCAASRNALTRITFAIRKIGIDVDSCGQTEFFTDGPLGPAVSAVQRTKVVAISQELALFAADLSLEHGLAMADAIVLATARWFRAELVTSDGDFESIPDVTYLPKKG